MTKSILTFLGIVICNLIFAQQFKPEVISNGGGFMSNANAQVTYTIGEVVTGDISNTSAMATQGFQQNWTISDVGIPEVINNNSIKVYPNPTSNIINIKFEKETTDKTIIEMLDISGKTLLNKNIEKNSIETKIDLSSYPNDIYIIKISTPTNKILGTYKIQKIK